MRDVGLKEVEVEMGMGKDGGGQGWGDCWLDEGFQAWLFGAGLETGPGEGVDGVVGGPSRDWDVGGGWDSGGWLLRWVGVLLCAIEGGDGEEAMEKGGGRRYG